ncbi:uncharacterized protein (TIGR02569 family) [Arthrobacter pascens]|uniref:hypothetical protein n=1 Tax=Arthrobacter pascens TaxID=1677 RepID=UPI00278F2652|nr:hypothetical protein [Arthrobacter pascens]MDQ0678328.1 uncharacterized protein (TIGR02569 family) [Arthrobacter pascens]
MVGTKPSVMPTPAVFAAFGAAGTPERMAGGRGLTWRSGQIVVRPIEDPEEAAWKSQVLAVIDSSEGFTVPRPIRDDRGNWVHDGWQATEWIPGVADETRVGDIVGAGEAFHRAIAGLPRPSFIAASNDPWSQADRIAWGEATLPADELLELLVAECRLVNAPSQVIHGDLLGNVLFAEGRPPAVIDWAPYWRPPGLGAAIAVVDAACWHGHSLDALADNHGIPQWRQLLLRALVFRMTTLHLFGYWDDAQADRHKPVAAAIATLTE